LRNTRVPVFHVESDIAASSFPASNLRKRAKRNKTRVSKVHRRPNAIHRVFECTNKHASVVNAILAVAIYFFSPSLYPFSIISALFHFRSPVSDLSALVRLRRVTTKADRNFCNREIHYVDECKTIEEKRPADLTACFAAVVSSRDKFHFCTTSLSSARQRVLSKYRTIKLLRNTKNIKQLPYIKDSQL